MYWKVTASGSVKHLVLDSKDRVSLCGIKKLTDNKLKLTLLGKCIICSRIEGTVNDSSN